MFPRSNGCSVEAVSHLGTQYPSQLKPLWFLGDGTVRVSYGLGDIVYHAYPYAE